MSRRDVAAQRHVVSVVRSSVGQYAWTCTCGSLETGWPTRSLAIANADGHAEKHEPEADRVAS